MATTAKINIGGRSLSTDEAGANAGFTGKVLVNYENGAQTIGASPDLQINGTGADALISFGRWSANAAGPVFIFGKSRGGSVGTNTVVQSGDILGGQEFYGADGSTFWPSAYIYTIATGTPGSSQVASYVQISTAADSASAGPAARLQVTQASTRPAADNSYSCGESGQRWSVVYAATGTINTSDAREKTDIADCRLGLDFVMSLRPVEYRWIAGGNDVEAVQDGFEEFVEDDGTVTQRPLFREVITPRPGRRVHVGLLAQDVKAALPSGTDWAMWTQDDPADPDSRQGLRPDHLIGPLIKAVQELTARVQALEAGAP